MPRLKSLVVPFVVLLAFGLAAFLVARQQHDGGVNVVNPGQEAESAIDDPVYVHRQKVAAVAVRDYPWYLHTGGDGLEERDLGTRIERVAYANSLNPTEAQEDHRRGQAVLDRLVDAKRRLHIAAKLTKDTGDPLPFWAAKSMLGWAEADWLLRQEVLHSLGRKHQLIDTERRVELECQSKELEQKVQKYWNKNFENVPILGSFPVTLP